MNNPALDASTGRSTIPPVGPGSKPPRVDIEKLVQLNLPPSPAGILKISRYLRDDDTPTRKIVEAISYEPPLVARILRLVNSPIYSLARNVTSVQMAIGVIGNKTLGELVMMMLGSSTFAKQISGSFFARKIWEHSIVVAVVAREIAVRMKMRGTEETFICGLLHDIGKFILLKHDAEGFAKILSEGRGPAAREHEREEYGYDHAEIGALVARRWGIQEEVCFTIRHHHNPLNADRAATVANIVQVADSIANAKGYGIVQTAINEEALPESFTMLQLRLEDMDEVWEKALREIEHVIADY